MLSVLLGIATSLTIVSDGKSEYTLVYAKIENMWVGNNYWRTAAEEFQIAVFNMTGVEIKIIDDTGNQPTKGIYLGPTKFSSGKVNLNIDLDDDYFETKLNNGNIYINGGKRAVCYGVYDILEDWGCRWYSSWMTVAPKQSVLTIPDDYTNSHRASIYYRETYTSDSMFEGYLGAHLRNNAGDSGLDAKYGGGLGALFGTHSMFGVDTKKYTVSKNPEIYAMKPDQSGRYSDAMCLSNANTFAFAKERVLSKLHEYVDNGKKIPHYIELSQGDNGRWCHCPECTTKYQNSGSCSYMHIEFLNKMCQTIEAEFPNMDYKVRTFLLVDSIRFPKGIVPNPHIYFRVCTIGNDMGRPLVLPYENNYMAENKQFMKDMEQWSTLQNAKFTLYDYTANFDTQGAFPHNLVITAAKNLKFLKQLLDLEGYLPEDIMYPKGQYHADMAELKAYLLMRLAYNIDLDIDEIMTDFCNGFYGKNAGPLVYRLMHEAEIEAARENSMVFWTTWGGIGSAIREDYIRHALRMWDNAIQAASKEGEIYKSNCIMSSLTTRAAMLHFMRIGNAVPTWRWTDGGVARVTDRDEGSAALLHRYIDEAPRTVASYFSKWKDISRFYGEVHPVSVKCAGYYKARFCAGIGGIGGTFQYIAEEYLGNHYGIDFVDQTKGRTFTSTDCMAFNETKEGDTFVYTYVGTTKTITKKFTLDEDGLVFQGSIDSTSEVRAIAQIELSLGDGTTLAYRVEEQEWQVKAVDKLAEFEFFGIASPPNKARITVADPKTKKGVIFELLSQIDHITFLVNATANTVRVILANELGKSSLSYRMMALINTEDVPGPIERPNYNDNAKVIKRFIVDDTMLAYGPTEDYPIACSFCSSGHGINHKSGTLQLYMADNFAKYGLIPFTKVNATMEVGFDLSAEDTGQMMVGCGYVVDDVTRSEVYRYIKAKNVENRKIVKQIILSNWNFSEKNSGFMQNHLSNKNDNKAIFDRMIVDILAYGPEKPQYTWDDGNSIGGGGVVSNIAGQMNDAEVCSHEDFMTGGSIVLIIFAGTAAAVGLYVFWWYRYVKQHEEEVGDAQSITLT